jgi:hypothetical protein
MEGACVKHESLEQAGRYWVGQDKQGRYMWKRAGQRFSLTRERGQDEHIHEVLQEDSHSSMYKVYDYIIVLEKADELFTVDRCANYVLEIIYACTS